MADCMHPGLRVCFVIKQQDYNLDASYDLFCIWLGTCKWFRSRKQRAWWAAYKCVVADAVPMAFHFLFGKSDHKNVCVMYVVVQWVRVYVIWCVLLSREMMYEDEGFRHRDLAALVVSKVEHLPNTDIYPLLVSVKVFYEPSGEK